MQCIWPHATPLSNHIVAVPTNINKCLENSENLPDKVKLKIVEFVESVEAFHNNDRGFDVFAFLNRVDKQLIKIAETVAIVDEGVNNKKDRRCFIKQINAIKCPLLSISKCPRATVQT